MRYALISDIHSNFEALKEVYLDISKKNIDEILNLGDSIGYNAQPNEVINFLKEKNIESILGNHDLALFNEKYLNKMNVLAKDAILKTREIITESNLNYLKDLALLKKSTNFYMNHGFPPDSVYKYIHKQKDDEINNVLNSLNTFKLFFVGHSHNLIILKINEFGFVSQHSMNYKKKLELDKNYKYIINVGSVGQPRDFNTSASYLIYDDKKNKIELNRVEYNIEKMININEEKDFPKGSSIKLKYAGLEAFAFM